MKLQMLVSLALVLCACQEDNSPKAITPPVPDSGMYISTQFDDDDLQIFMNVPYSVRPNYNGIQYTSDDRKEIEKGQTDLTLHMDIAVPPNATATEPQPLIIYIHGGGFSGGSKSAFHDATLSYAKAGYVAATIDYRLTPDNQANATIRTMAVRHAVEDAMNAIRFLKANATTYHIDVTRIATIGSSAGGGISLTNAIGADELDMLSDFPTHSAKVHATVSTGATLSSDSLVDQSTLRYDASDCPVLLFHNGAIDPVTGATWDDVLQTKARIDASGNTCDVVAQSPDSHTANLALNGKFWDEMKLFFWIELRLYERN